MTDKKEPATRQKSISFRIGTKTSKVSIQPILYEALSFRMGGDHMANSFIKDMVLLSIIDKVKDKSLYVQSKALLELVPEHAKLNITDDDLKKEGRATVRFKIPSTGTVTKLTTFPILLTILDNLLQGKGEEMIKKTAIAIHRAKDAEAAALLEKGETQPKKCDVSHLVRERVLNLIIASTS